MKQYMTQGKCAAGETYACQKQNGGYMRFLWDLLYGFAVLCSFHLWQMRHLYRIQRF